MARAVFFHVSSPDCVNAEQSLLGLLDNSKCDVEMVNICQNRDRIIEAMQLGVKRVPALVIDKNVLHINSGPTIETAKI